MKRSRAVVFACLIGAMVIAAIVWSRVGKRAPPHLPLIESDETRVIAVAKQHLGNTPAFLGARYDVQRESDGWSVYVIWAANGYPAKDPRAMFEPGSHCVLHIDSSLKVVSMVPGL